MKHILALLCCLALVQCAPVKIPLLEGATLDEARRLTLSLRLNEREQAFHSGKILMRAHLKKGQEEASFRYAIVFEKPDKLRIETLPELAAYTLGLYVSQAGSQILLDTESKMAFRAGSERSLLRSLVKLPLSDEELVSLLSSTIPSRDIENLKSNQGVAVEGTGNTYTLMSSDKKKIWKIDKQTLIITEVTIYSEFNEAVVVRATTQGVLPNTTPTVPQTILLSFPEEKLTTDLETIAFRVNEPVQQKMFEVQIPPGYTISDGPPRGIE